MKEFTAMRKLAADKRDKAYKKARNEYETALIRIAELEQMICGKVAPGHLQVSKAIEQVMPDDRPFTLNDVLGILEASHPERDWKRHSVYVALNRFLKQGAIKRIAHAGHKRAAIFALPSVPLEPAKTMLDWAKEVEGWQGMEPVKLMVKMTENGYQMEVAPKDAVQSLKRQLEKHC